MESFEKIDADNQLVAIGERLEETSIEDLSSFSFDPSMLIPKFESCSDLKKDSRGNNLCVAQLTRRGRAPPWGIELATRENATAFF